MKTVLIGAGYRGKGLLGLMKEIPFFELAAVADPYLAKSGALANQAGLFDGLAVYSDGPDDYLRMLKEQQPELAVICSPWDCHIPQAEACLKAGCNVALEIRGGKELGEYDPLKDLPGKVFPMENLIFRRDILAVHEMARKGLFGELVFMKGGYRHDLRDELIDAEGVLGGDAVADGAGHPRELWRGKAYMQRNGDIYPTHSIAPLCLIGDVHSFKQVTSVASKAAGLSERLGDACPHVSLGDIVNTLARTADGTLISIIHDTTLPRPKSFGIEIQGTKGVWDETTHRIYVEGRSAYEQWEPDSEYIEEFLDPMWRAWGADAERLDRHHGGMDYIMLKAIEEDLRGGYQYPVSLGDLALWTSITPLSCRSIAEGRTIDLP